MAVRVHLNLWTGQDLVDLLQKKQKTLSVSEFRFHFCVCPSDLPRFCQKWLQSVV